MIVWEQSQLYRRLRSSRHGVILLIGTGQQGKTVAANTLANLPPLASRTVALVNYPADFVKTHYPARYRAVRWPDDISAIPKLLRHSRDLVLIDDAAWLTSARDSSTRANRDIQKLITVSSHMELYIVVTIQSTSLLDISMMQSQDVIMLHKRMDPVALEFERPEFLARQALANSEILRARRASPKVPPKAWTWCSTTCELLRLAPPPWWEPIMSKPYMCSLPLLQKRPAKKKEDADDERRHDHRSDGPAQGPYGRAAEPADPRTARDRDER